MSLSYIYQGGGLDADHNYSCAYCQETNSLFVDGSATWLFDPTGSQTQLLTQECEACLELNLLTITVNREGSVRVRAEKRVDELDSS